MDDNNIHKPGEGMLWRCQKMLMMLEMSACRQIFPTEHEFVSDMTSAHDDPWGMPSNF